MFKSLRITWAQKKPTFIFKSYSVIFGFILLVLSKTSFFQSKICISLSNGCLLFQVPFEKLEDLSQLPGSLYFNLIATSSNFSSSSLQSCSQFSRILALSIRWTISALFNSINQLICALSFFIFSLSFSISTLTKVSKKLSQKWLLKKVNLVV